MDQFGSSRMDELAALTAVAREGSFVKASRVLERHPTIISKRIAALETRLGVRLVERTTRNVRMTEAGARLAEQVMAAHELINLAEGEVSARAVEPRGLVRVSLPASMGRRWLAKLLPSFLRLYPSISLDVRFSEHFVDLVGGGFDVAVRIGTLSDSGLVARKLGSHRRILCASPTYVRDHGSPKTPEEISGHQCLQFTGFASYPDWCLTDGMKEHTIHPRGQFVADDSEALVFAAVAGLGIIGAGEWLVARELAEGALVRILPGYAFDIDGGIHLVRPSKHHTPAHIDSFCKWMADQFENGPPWQSLLVRES